MNLGATAKNDQHGFWIKVDNIPLSIWSYSFLHSSVVDFAQLVDIDLTSVQEILGLSRFNDGARLKIILKKRWSLLPWRQVVFMGKKYTISFTEIEDELPTANKQVLCTPWLLFGMPNPFNQANSRGSTCFVRGSSRGRGRSSSCGRVMRKISSIDMGRLTRKIDYEPVMYTMIPAIQSPNFQRAYTTDDPSIIGGLLACVSLRHKITQTRHLSEPQFLGLESLYLFSSYRLLKTMKKSLILSIYASTKKRRTMCENPIFEEENAWNNAEEDNRLHAMDRASPLMRELGNSDARTENSKQKSQQKAVGAQLRNMKKPSVGSSSAHGNNDMIIDSGPRFVEDSTVPTDTLMRSLMRRLLASKTGRLIRRTATETEFCVVRLCVSA